MQNIYTNEGLAAFTKHPGNECRCYQCSYMWSEVYETSTFLSKYSCILAPSPVTCLGMWLGSSSSAGRAGWVHATWEWIPRAVVLLTFASQSQLGSDSCCLRKKVKYKTDWDKFKPCPSRQYECICKESLCRYCFRLPFCGYCILVLQVKIRSYGYSLVSIRFTLFFFFL